MRYTPKLVRALAATFITIGSLPGEANAAAYYTFTEENGDVVLRASGTLDVTQFSFSNDITRDGYVYLDNIWIAPMVYGPADVGDGVAILRNRFGWNIPFAARSAGVIESGDTFVAVFADGDASTFIQSPTTLVNGSFDSSIITPNMVVRWNGYDFNSMGMDLITPDTDILIWKSNVLAGDEGSIFLRISTIPEPSSSFLVGLGALWLTVRRRRI